jgi:Ca-activated chloride channel family protein
MKRNHSLLELSLALTVFVLGCGGVQDGPTVPTPQPPQPGTATKVDDWSFSPGSSSDATYSSASGGKSAGASAPVPAVPPPAATTGTGTIGLAAGGAKDANNFRANVANNYLPLTTDITYEGVFYDYYFDTGAAGPCDALFCPSYVPMLSTDPLSEAQEPFLSVGLNSGIKESDFARKQLDLVVVLDVSGSMGEAFNSYYYDQNGKQVQNTEDAGKTKLALATESIVAMMGHLQAGDRLGVVIFTDGAAQLKALSLVGETDMNALASQILGLGVQGGTNLEAGYKLGADMLARLGTVDPQVYENRIILLTDAMPNTGDTSATSLAGMVGSNANQRIFTTFIGIGVDFNSTLIELLTKTRGANYYSVHNSQEFKQRMDAEFDYMVTPLVFDLRLALQSDGFAVKDVYGSPEANQATGQLIFVNTLFPSKSEDGQTKGGVILVLLEHTGASSQVKLSASYLDRNGVAAGSEVAFDYTAVPDQAPNTGVRKAVLLARYVRLIKAWIAAERQSAAAQAGATYDSTWERTSLPLTVSAAYKAQLAAFSTYFKSEMAAIGDDTLAQEVTVLDKLAQ